MTVKTPPDMWKILFIAALSIIATLVATNFTNFTKSHDFITQAQALELVKTQSPYALDKKWLEEKIDNVVNTTNDTKSMVTTLTEKVNNIKLDIEAMRNTSKR